MKALPVEKLPEGDWLYEIKFDGYRALAFKDGKDVRLVSRNQKAFDYTTTWCPKVVAGRMLHSRRRNCCARRERSLFVPASPNIQKLWQCPVGLFCL